MGKHFGKRKLRCRYANDDAGHSPARVVYDCCAVRYANEVAPFLAPLSSFVSGKSAVSAARACEAVAEPVQHHHSAKKRRISLYPGLGSCIDWRRASAAWAQRVSPQPRCPARSASGESHDAIVRRTRSPRIAHQRIVNAAQIARKLLPARLCDCANAVAQRVHETLSGSASSSSSSSSSS